MYGYYHRGRYDRFVTRIRFVMSKEGGREGRKDASRTQRERERERPYRLTDS
jgi:hypothetical protein